MIGRLVMGVFAGEADCAFAGSGNREIIVAVIKKRIRMILDSSTLNRKSRLADLKVAESVACHEYALLVQRADKIHFGGVQSRFSADRPGDPFREGEAPAEP